MKIDFLVLYHVMPLKCLYIATYFLLVIFLLTTAKKEQFSKLLSRYEIR